MEQKRSPTRIESLGQVTIAAIGYLLALVLVFHQVVLHPLTQVLSFQYGDLIRLFYPMRVFALEQAKVGHFLPLWDPHVYGGAPFLGNFESALLYPFNFLFFFLPIPAAFNAFFLLHELMAGLFMYLWTSSKKFDPLACWLAGILYMFCGAFFLHIYAGHVDHLATAAWAPLVFLVLDKLLVKGGASWMLAGMAVLTLQFFAGYPQYFYIFTLMAGLYVLLNLWGKPKALSRLGRIALVYGGAAALTAVQWAAGWAASAECFRGQHLSYAFSGSFSLPPEYLLTSVFPDLFEKFQVFRYGRSIVFWDSNLFLGTTTMVLVAFAWKGAPLSLRRPCLWLVLAASLLAFGSYTPLFRFFYDLLPGISHLRGSSKFKLAASMFLILLAAAGLDSLLRSEQRERHRAFPWLAGSGMILVVLGLSLSILSPGMILEKMASWAGDGLTLSEGTWREAQSAAGADFLLSGAVCLAIGGLVRFAARPNRLALGVVLIACSELFFFTQNHLTSTDWRALTAQNMALTAFLKNSPGDYRLISNMGNRVETVGGSNLWGSDPFVPLRYFRFVAFTQGKSDVEFQDLVGNNMAFSVVSGMFRLIRGMFSAMDLKDHLSVMRFSGKELPRISLMGQWEKHTDAEGSLERLADPHFPYLTRAVVEEDPGFSSYKGSPGGSLKITDLSTNDMEVTADLPRPALLVIGGNFTEGWKIRSYPDSGAQNERVIPADYILRAVPLMKGHHHFSLVYRPTAYVAGLWISIFSLVLYLGAVGLWLSTIFSPPRHKDTK